MQGNCSSVAREKKITRVTLLGSVMNLILSVGKVLAGVFGHSAAMIADGIHSVSDLASDIVVLVFVRISSKGEDRDHEYGHGKFETLATLIMSLILIVVAAQLMASGIRTIVSVLSGGTIPPPKYVALIAAVVSIVSKEWLYRYTAAVGKCLNSPVVVANAWHHRSDAFSSIGSLIGIAGAMLLGNKWTLLDPLASCCISIAVFVVAVKMAGPSLKELLDVSLPADMEREIISVASGVAGVRNVHGLKTRRNGPSIVMEAHIVVDSSMTVEKAHDISTAVEEAIKERFGNETQISLHLEPDVNAK